MAIIDEPVVTDLYERADEFRAPGGSIYAFGESAEERSQHLEKWRATCCDVRFLQIVSDSPTAFVSVSDDGSMRDVSLRSRSQLDAIWGVPRSGKIYIDITGLSHHVWAPMLRAAIGTGCEVAVVYVEPGQYSFSAAPTSGQIFDLSERIRGIGPIPGFASLTQPRRGGESLFVPLLGFEGTRLAHLIEHVQPGNERIVPIIGVPGFRPEYPFYTYAGNQRPLAETKSWQRARFAAANCPFSVFYLLERLASEYAKAVLRIAPIGTKPHALGAVLFKLASERVVELVYDHPIRKVGRTRASDRLLVYHVSALLAGGAR